MASILDRHYKEAHFQPQNVDLCRLPPNQKCAKFQDGDRISWIVQKLAASKENVTWYMVLKVYYIRLKTTFLPLSDIAGENGLIWFESQTATWQHARIFQRLGARPWNIKLASKHEMVSRFRENVVEDMTEDFNIAKTFQDLILHRGASLKYYTDCNISYHETSCSFFTFSGAV